jgi:spermidine synthase
MLKFSSLLSGIGVLEERKSKFNGDIKVVKSLGYGVLIQANGLTQSGGIVETIWKQTIRKVKSQKSKIKNCLILGLGGGTVVKLIRKSWPEVEITGVDIDPTMIELGKKYLKLDDYKIKIVIADAFKFTMNKSLKTEYDLIIVDLYQGDQFPKKFETENYIQLVRTVLSSGGVTVFNRLYYGEKRPQAVKFGNKLKKVFKNVEWYYPEANLMFICN